MVDELGTEVKSKHVVDGAGAVAMVDVTVAPNITDLVVLFFSFLSYLLS